MRHSANIAHFGSRRHACSFTPNHASMALSRPVASSLYIHVHTMDMATTGVT